MPLSNTQWHSLLNELLCFQMTEMFIGHIANKAYHYTKLGKRKTVQDRDVMSCVINNDELAFLEGMLESEGK